MLVARSLKLKYTASSLERCVRAGLVNAVKEHILNGIDIGPTIFARIARNGDKRMVDALLSAGVELDTLFLKSVILHGYIPLAFYLLDEGGIAPDSSCIDQAAKINNIELIEHMLDLGAEATSFALEKAVKFNNLPLVKKLIGLKVQATRAVMEESLYNNNPDIKDCLMRYTRSHL